MVKRHCLFKVKGEKCGALRARFDYLETAGTAGTTGTTEKFIIILMILCFAVVSFVSVVSVVSKKPSQAPQPQFLVRRARTTDITCTTEFLVRRGQMWSR